MRLVHKKRRCRHALLAYNGHRLRRGMRIGCRSGQIVCLCWFNMVCPYHSLSASVCFGHVCIMMTSRGSWRWLSKLRDIGARLQL